MSLDEKRGHVKGRTVAGSASKFEGKIWRTRAKAARVVYGEGVLRGRLDQNGQRQKARHAGHKM